MSIDVFRLGLVVLASLSVVATPAGGAGAPPLAAYPPLDMDMAEHRRLVGIAQLVATGRFDEAAARLKPLAIPNPITVHVADAEVPQELRVEYARAVQTAIANWSAAGSGVWRFTAAAKPQTACVSIVFARSVQENTGGIVRATCMQSRLLTAPPRRRVEATISVARPFGPEPHSEASVSHLVAQAIGVYLGLPRSSNGPGVMSPDNHVADPTGTPSPDEARVARQAHTVRGRLQALAASRTRVVVPLPRYAPTRTEADAGTVVRGQPANFEFVIRNRGQAPLAIDVRPNCDCTVPTYDRIIAPGAEGRIKAVLRTSEFRGEVNKTLVVTTNDPKAPASGLYLTATVVSIATIEPGDDVAIPLSDTGPTTKVFTVRLPTTENAEITSAASSTPLIATNLRALPDNAGHRVWEVVATIGAGAPLGRMPARILLKTTSQREPELRINLRCEKGIVVTPASLYLGVIDGRPPKPISRALMVTRATGNLRITGVSSDDPALIPKLRTVRDGLEYRVDVSYTGGWPVGWVQKRVTLTTDDPLRPSVAVPVMARIAR